MGARRAEAAAAVTFLALGIGLTVAGFVRGIPGLWAPGVAFLAVGAAYGMKQRRG